jgi:hypothetical protein
LRVPKKLVLSEEAVEIYAKVDGNFRQLLEATGHKVFIILDAPSIFLRSPNPLDEMDFLSPNLKRVTLD